MHEIFRWYSIYRRECLNEIGFGCGIQFETEPTFIRINVVLEIDVLCFDWQPVRNPSATSCDLNGTAWTTNDCTAGGLPANSAFDNSERLALKPFAGKPRGSIATTLDRSRAKPVAISQRQ